MTQRTQKMERTKEGETVVYKTKWRQQGTDVELSSSHSGGTAATYKAGVKIKTL